MESTAAANGSEALGSRKNSGLVIGDASSRVGDRRCQFAGVPQPL